MILTSYLVLAAVVFCLGLYGFFTRRNVFVLFFSVILMLNAANINLLAFSRFLNKSNGVFFTLVGISISFLELLGFLLISLLLSKNIKRESF